ncbi:hypothetical protein [Streptomyces tendae]|uniref:hypothetical protein n=1 Tax=Streptomyces tendae TaxID=1932 RepID=UPI003714A4C0
MAHRVAEAVGVLGALAAGAVGDAVAEGLGLDEGKGAVEGQFYGEEGGRPAAAHAAEAAVVQGATRTRVMSQPGSLLRRRRRLAEE